MSLLLRVMLSVLLAASVRRVGVIKDKVEERLASPDLRHVVLGQPYLLGVLMVLMALAVLVAGRRQVHRGLGVLQLARGARLRGGNVVARLLVVRRGRVLQGQVALVDVDGEGDAMTGRHDLHARADRRDRGGRVQLHQSRLQLQGVHGARSRRDESSPVVHTGAK